MKNKSMALMREAMMHFLYTHFLLNTSVADSQLQLNQDPNFNDYQLQKVTLILTKLHHILNMISQHMKIDWSFARLACIDKAILVIATYEIIYEKLDYKIAINEAIKMSKKYGNSTDYKYINGVLEAIKTHQ